MRYVIKNLLRFFGLPAAEQWLLFKAVFLLVVLRLGIWLLPFQTFYRLLSRLARIYIPPPDDQEVPKKKIVRAVEIAGRHMPWAGTCLTLALATQVLLARRGCQVLLCIGVARSEDDKFEAHAWVESEGEVIIGGTELDRYSPLTVLAIEQK